MKGLIFTLMAALSLPATAASLTVSSSEGQVAAGATLAFGCFRGPDLHLRFERVPADQEIPSRSALEVSDGNRSLVQEVDLRAFRVGEAREIGITLSATPAATLIANSDGDSLLVRLPQLAVPVAARFDAESLARLRRALNSCR